MDAREDEALKEPQLGNSLPHQGAMRLLTGIVRLDVLACVGEFEVRLLASSPCFDKDGNFMTEWLIEMMAQGVASLFHFRSHAEDPGRPPQIGFLVGIESFEIEGGAFAALKAGELVIVGAQLDYDFFPVGQYRTWARCGDLRIASAEMRFIVDHEGKLTS